MDENKILEKCSYVSVSSYRRKVMEAIGGEIKTPTKISEESGIRSNHISKVLNELKSKNLLVCINEEVRKGRLYKLTEEGAVVLNKLFELEL